MGARACYCRLSRLFDGCSLIPRKGRVHSFFPGVDTVHDQSRGSGQKVSTISRGESGGVRNCSKSDGLGLVRRFPNMTGPVTRVTRPDLRYLETS